METINGCTLIPASEAPEPVSFGATETDGAYRVLAGTIPPGQPAPPFHVHPHTDEAFYIAGGEATFLLGDRQVRVTAGGLYSSHGGCPTPPGTPATTRCLG
jgi:mannose-6-phosphate isomerase-like protein (cupin superfamily)